jgi:hypothetical protein
MLPSNVAETQHSNNVTYIANLGRIVQQHAQSHETIAILHQ